MNTETAAKLIRESNGKQFWVKFVKRSTGELREMHAEYSDKGINGKGARYSFAEKGLIPVWDKEVQARRSIPIEGIVKVCFGNTEYNVVSTQSELF